MRRNERYGLSVGYDAPTPAPYSQGIAARGAQAAHRKVNDFKGLRSAKIHGDPRNLALTASKGMASGVFTSLAVFPDEVRHD